MFGVHQGITPIMINNLMTNGFENVICCMQAVPFTTCAVVFAVYLKSKNKKIKETALPAAISSFFGVSEPSIYGVTLPLKVPFVITLFCSAVGGAITGAWGSICILWAAWVYLHSPPISILQLVLIFRSTAF